MEKFRRHNSAPMCDLQFAVSLDGGLSQTLFGRTEEYSSLTTDLHADGRKNQKQLAKNGKINDESSSIKNEYRNSNGRSVDGCHPRWSLMQAAQGTVAHLVTSSEAASADPPSTNSEHDDWTLEDTAGEGFADIDANPMRRCLRQDAQSYLRQITKLEQQLKAERENGRLLVLAHHQESEALKDQLNNKDEDLRQSKNQCERFKEGYEQVMRAMQVRDSGPSQVREDENAMQIAYERMKASEKHWQKKFEESDAIVKALRGKLDFHGLGDTRTSTKFSYTIKEYEEVNQLLIKVTQEHENSRQSLAANASKWGQEIKALKAKADSAVAELDLAKRTIDDLKGQLHSEKERFGYLLRRTEKENLGKHVALVSEKEADLRKVAQQKEHTERQALQHLFAVMSETL